MIHNVITSIGLRLDEFIKNKLSLTEDTVIVSSLVDAKGNLNQDIENKVSIFLLNIEEDKVSKNVYSSFGGNPSVKINLYLMFSAYFQNFNYLEALRYISLVIEFFQTNSVFDFSNTPGLSQDVEKIHVELHNVPIEDVNKLWSNIGANYVPSIVYKFKQIVFDGEMISEDTPNIL